MYDKLQIWGYTTHAARTFTRIIKEETATERHRDNDTPIGIDV
jgi:hypothetical protein